MADQSTLYSRWLNGELSEAEINELKANGADQELSDIIKAVDLWESQKIDLDKAFERQLTKRKSGAKVKRLFPSRMWVAAASMAILITSLFVMNNRSMTYDTGFNSNEMVQLSDGTSVILNDGSSISVRKGIFSNKRKVSLSGEAYFKVTKGEQFTVNSPQGIVQVLGTEFNVRNWGRNLVVECYEGRVRVSKNEQAAILTQGESVMIIDGQLNSKSEIQREEPAWTSGASIFNDEVLEQVFEEVERQYDIQITYQRGDQKFSGQFTHNDLNAALDAICIPLGLTYQISSDQKSVTISE